MTKPLSNSLSSSSDMNVDMTFFPEPFEWVRVSKGDVIISHPFYNISEVIHASVGNFYISKYPITNDQFDYYLHDTGQNAKASSIQRTEEFLKGNHPVIDIFYFEALNFCRWLSRKIDHIVTLPSDTQWMRAARDSSVQQYPWGDDWNGTQCNTKETNIGHTTPVNHYPNGASAFGVMDMLGNSYEWCCTDPATGENHLDDNADKLDPFRSSTEVHRVFMGGCFDSSIRGASLDRYGGATTTSYSYVTSIRLVLNL